jgi:3-deoxy-D-manno-octulosonic-acid transferase
MYFAYSALLAIVLVLGSPYWLYEMLRHGKYRKGLAERLGVIPARIRNLSQRTIWIHAVSVGEVLAVGELVRELRSAFLQYRVLVSTTTDTGQRLAAERFGQDNVFYFPLDFGFAVRRWIRALQPELIIVAETELWPNFLRAARECATKVAIVNARISDRSIGGYLRAKRLIAPVLQNADLFLAQTDQDAQRLREIGAPADRVLTVGNLKYDMPPPAAPPIVDAVRRSLASAGAGPVLVCGSTVDGEEPLLLGAFTNILANFPGAVMLLAPRHPQRFDEVGRLLRELNLPFWRRSKWTDGPLRGGVLLVDTIGELSSLYALADIAFVGGSLVPGGGHNIIEPAQHGVVIVVGNHTENFRDIVGLFQSRDAVRIVGPAELPLTLMQLLSNDAERHALGQRAAETMQSQRGATQRTIAQLKNLLGTAENARVVMPA